MQLFPYQRDLIVSVGSTWTAIFASPFGSVLPKPHSIAWFCATQDVGNKNHQVCNVTVKACHESRHKIQFGSGFEQLHKPLKVNEVEWIRS